MYEIHIGKIPDSLCIDHLCRRRDCCNPAHLEAVTRATNNRRGEKTKLSNTDIIAIKELLKDRTKTQKDIATQFNVCQENISAINTGKIWT
jgi:hypothetical protein